MSSEPTTDPSVETPPPSPTVPVNPEPSNQSDPAFVPSPLQQEPPKSDEPWATDEFKAQVAAAGFPGSPQTDDAFLAALYRFSNPAPTSSEPAPTA